MISAHAIHEADRVLQPVPVRGVQHRHIQLLRQMASTSLPGGILVHEHPAGYTPRTLPSRVSYSGDKACIGVINTCILNKIIWPKN